MGIGECWGGCPKKIPGWSLGVHSPGSGEIADHRGRNTLAMEMGVKPCTFLGVAEWGTPPSCGGGGGGERFLGENVVKTRAADTCIDIFSRVHHVLIASTGERG